MPKLWLLFKDEDGVEQRVEVARTPFTIGRHSECDLTVVDGLLSREHLRIDMRAGKFTAADAGSSNGSTLNGTSLAGDPVILEDKDELNLGGGLTVVVEIQEAEADIPTGADPLPAAEPEPLSPVDAAQFPTAMPAATAADSGGGFPMAFFIIAPLAAIFVLAFGIGAIVLFGGGDKRLAKNSDDYTYSNDDDPIADDEPPDDSTPKPSKSSTPSVTGSPATDGPVANSTPGPGANDLPPVTDNGETAKVERHGATFVRQIAQNDPNAFLTGEQAAKVDAKVKQLGRSSALADNINAANKNAAAIKALAAQKNLKPQFLAVAAMTKLGGSRGDVVNAAQSVAAVYDELQIQIGDENFDEALLMVAAYDQGAAGGSMKIRNMLQELATKSKETSRTIRSIWFLVQAGKISNAEYDRALSFLAIGTIAQNPKEFGVNAEALKL